MYKIKVSSLKKGYANRPLSTINRWICAKEWFSLFRFQCPGTLVVLNTAPAKIIRGRPSPTGVAFAPVENPTDLPSTFLRRTCAAPISEGQTLNNEKIRSDNCLK